MKKKLSKPTWCANFIKDGCQKDKCPFAHLSSDAIEAIKDAKRNSKALAATSRKTEGKWHKLKQKPV